VRWTPRRSSSTRGDASGIPLGRLTTPEDVADLAVVLASDTSRFVTGQSWHVDGGQTLP
jgi:2,3-dihydro-2,3-dihydroxybenzoate dehydrogenase